VHKGNLSLAENIQSSEAADCRYLYERTVKPILNLTCA